MDYLKSIYSSRELNLAQQCLKVCACSMYRCILSRYWNSRLKSNLIERQFKQEVLNAMTFDIKICTKLDKSVEVNEEHKSELLENIWNRQTVQIGFSYIWNIKMYSWTLKTTLEMCIYFIYLVLCSGIVSSCVKSIQRGILGGKVGTWSELKPFLLCIELLCDFVVIGFCRVIRSSSGYMA